MLEKVQSQVEHVMQARLASLPTFALAGRCIPYDPPPEFSAGAEQLCLQAVLFPQ